jgi:hypothetical protein
LLVGERGPERGQAGVVAAAGEGDGDRVDGSFDEHSSRAGGEQWAGFV